MTHCSISIEKLIKKDVKDAKNRTDINAK